MIKDKVPANEVSWLQWLDILPRLTGLQKIRVELTLLFCQASYTQRYMYIIVYMYRALYIKYIYVHNDVYL